MTDTVLFGSLLLAVPIAMLAGFVSFASPCVLPLAPGYLAYVTSLTGADLARRPAAGRVRVPVGAPHQDPSTGSGTGDAGSGTGDAGSGTGDAGSGTGDAGSGTGDAGSGTGDAGSGTEDAGSGTEDAGSGTGAGPTRGRVVLGALLFVAGFSVVFVSYGVLFGGLGAWLLTHQRLVGVVLGAAVVVLGLGFAGAPLLGSAMWFNRERRSRYRPARGLWGAPVLGVVFGLGWTPCIGPTLAAVQTLAFTEASAARGAVLSLAYCAGLGVPFVLIAWGLRWSAGLVDWSRRHHRGISAAGGAMLVAVGVLLITGWWGELVVWLQSLTSGFSVVV